MLTVRHIVCAVDFSEFSARALAHAAALARWYDARLTALHVWANIPAFNVVPSIQRYENPSASLEDAERAALTQELTSFCRHVAGGVAFTPVLAEAPGIEDEIAAQVNALHADLLVVGSHGRSGFQHVLLGSVAEKIVRKAPCPVMVVPPRDATTVSDVSFKKIVCPVDFSETSLAALEYALSLAEESDSRLTLVYALELPPELHALPTSEGVDVDAVRAAAQADALTRLRALIPVNARAYCTVETIVADGKAHRAVLATARETHADLIVMGVSGHGALDRWVFGSNTASVMRAAACPVLIVRQPGAAVSRAA